MTERIADTRAGNPGKSSLAYPLWVGILGVLVVLGVVFFLLQSFIIGHHITGLTNEVPWGLYIAGFVFFIGASAGSTIIGLMIHGFGREDYAPLGTRAIAVGIAALIASVMFIMMDQGQFIRIFMVPWLWHNATSMFLITSSSYYLFFLILLGELYYTVKLTRGTATERDKKRAKVLSIFAVPYALALLHAITGTVFGVVKAREWWNSSLLPPHFAIVALASGVALIILMASVTAKYRGKDLVSKATMSHLGVLLAFFIGIAAFMDVFDFLVYSYSDKLTGREVIGILFGGGHIGFSLIHVIGYALAFVILLYRRGRETPWVTTAAVVTLIAIAAYRYNLVTVGLLPPILPFLPDASYFPTFAEIAISVGIVALVCLVYTWLVRRLPLEEDFGLAGAAGPAGAGPAGASPAPMAGAAGPPAVQPERQALEWKGESHGPEAGSRARRS